MAEAKKVLAVGSALVDILALVEDPFLSLAGGEKGGMMMVEAEFQDQLIAKLAQPPSYVPGGAAGNTIVGLGMLGLPVAMLSKVGRDDNADFYRREFRAAGGSDREFIACDEAVTGRCLSLVTPDSERTMRSHLGASQLLTVADVKAVDFKQYDLVFIEGYMLFLPEIVQTVLREAKQAGCLTALDMASFEVVRIFRSALFELFSEKLVDFIFANEDEAAALLDAKDDEETMARKLGELCSVAALKVGRRGSYVVRGSELVRIAPVTVENPLDTTAAGDLWATGFLFGYLQGWPLAECGYAASLISSEVVKVMGSALAQDVWNTIKRTLKLRNE